MITIQRLIARVRKLAKANPDYVYDPGENELGIRNDCMYAPDENQPGCIFGQALEAEGIHPSDDWEGNSIDNILEDLGVKMTPAQKDWVANVQNNQDSRLPWGKAVAEEDKRQEYANT